MNAMAFDFYLEPWLQKPFATFKNALQNNLLPGSVILSCPEGLGGKRLAIAMAKLYLCHEPTDEGACGHCSSCKAFDNGRHADFVHVKAVTAQEQANGISHDPNVDDENIEGDDTNLTSTSMRFVRIDSLRAMQDALSASAVMGKRKVALITDAHLMQTVAANAVLKTFEEPPSNTLIIMHTSSLDALLPTVLSRAFKLSVSSPDLETARASLKELCTKNSDLAGTDDLKLSIALALFNNAPYGALNFLQAQRKIGREKSYLIDDVLNALQSFAKALEGKEAIDEAVNYFKALPPELCARVLLQFILEDLKYKAHCDPQTLPILKNMPLSIVSRLPAKHLFKASDDLKYICAKAPLLSSRAPYALIRVWIQALIQKP